MNIFEVQNYLQLVLFLVALGIKGFAFVSSLLYPTQAYPAAGKGNKAAWAIGLGVGFVAQLLLPGPLGIINLVCLIGAGVYLADVRPALASVTNRR